MRNLSRRFSAAVVILALAVGNAAICAGWMPTREARMACCAEGACPMHKSDSHESLSRRGVSQAQADSCCAASERDEAAPSSLSFVSSMTLAVVASPVPFLPEALTLSTGWPTQAPIPGTHVPKHLLLSVLLV